MTDRHQTNPTLREQAIQWVVRLRSGEATAQDHQQLNVWLDAHPRHRWEFEQVSGMLTGMVEARASYQEEISQAKDTWARHAPSVMSESSFWGWASPRRVTAGLFIILLLLGSLFWVTRPPEAVHYQTAKGGQQSLVLADGSSVFLNTDSQISVQFSRSMRSVRLERGEAWFTVSEDTQRPFQVEVANGIIHDIGTQFIVNKLSERVEVSVLDGMVEVKVSSSPNLPAVLHRGEYVSYGMDGRMSAIELFNSHTAGAWKDGKLIFEDRPFGEVLNELARYRSEEMRLVDTTLADIPVTVAFNLRELESSIDLLQDVLPIRVQRVTPDLILIARTPSSPSAPHSSRR